MDFFVSLILCHGLLLRHKVLIVDANLHEAYTLVDSRRASILLVKINDIIKKNIYSPFLYCSLDVCGQLQTTIQFAVRNIAASYYIQVGEIYYVREMLSVSDGTLIALDWAYSSALKQTQRHQPVSACDDQGEDNGIPIIVLHHGLCGDSSSEHIVLLARKFLTCKITKFRVVVVVMRGCGGIKLSSSNTMNGSRTGDIRAAVEHLKHKYPKSRLFGVGFSLGAAVILKYLGEEGNATALEAAVCVSPPWDGRKKGPYFPLWSVFLALPVKLYALRHRMMLDKRLNLMSILTARTLGEVDTLLALSYGFETVDEYYAACSPLALAANIMIPTLAISAMDDPVCSHHSVPLRQSTLQNTFETSHLPVCKNRGEGIKNVPFCLTSEQSCDAKTIDTDKDIDADLNIDDTGLSTSLLGEDSQCGLVLLKTLLGGHLAFPSIYSSNDTDSDGGRFSFSFLTHMTNSWSDDITYDWILSFFPVQSS